MMHNKVTMEAAVGLQKIPNKDPRLFCFSIVRDKNIPKTLKKQQQMLGLPSSEVSWTERLSYFKDTTVKDVLKGCSRKSPRRVESIMDYNNQVKRTQSTDSSPNIFKR